jgi:hypothetical protein
VLRCCHPWFLVAPEHNSMPCPFLRPSPLLDAALCRDKRCESSTAASRFTACAGARRHPCATTGLEHPAPPGTIQHAAGAAAATRSNRHALADMCHSCISAAFAAALQQHHLERAIQQCSAAGCCAAGQLAGHQVPHCHTSIGAHALRRVASGALNQCQCWARAARRAVRRTSRSWLVTPHAST